MRAPVSSQPVAVQRGGAKLEKIGFLIILASMIVGGVGMLAEASCLWVAIGGLSFAAGLIVFIIGRFN
jgi:hypothetical protein